MPPPKQARLLPSVYDRLVDPDCMTGSFAGYDHRQMLDAVRSDLEHLLNTRLTFADLPAHYAQSADSLLTYGLPDLSGFDMAASGQQFDMSRTIARIINRFEPRLRRVRVSVMDTAAKGGMAVRLRVEAELNLNPAPEVGFETVLELITGRATVQPADAVG